MAISFGRRWRMLQSIMVVEPDVYLMKALSLFLRRDGYTVIKLDGSGDVMCAIRHYAPALVVIDQQQGGGDLCRQIRSDAQTAHIPAIMLALWDDPASM